MKKWLSIVAGGIFVLALFIFIVGSLWTGSDVRRYCKTAIRIYGNDCVSALSALVDDKSMPFRDRNNAVWALGQLGNSKALPYLTKYYTGVVANNENTDTTLSQRKISDAIRLIQGQINLTAIIWRHGIQ